MVYNKKFYRFKKCTKQKSLTSLAIFQRGKGLNFEISCYSPFFNKNQKVRSLCDLILKFAPDYQHPALDKKKSLSTYFGGKSYNELQINNIISDLLQLAYSFLAQKSMAQSCPNSKKIICSKSCSIAMLTITLIALPEGSSACKATQVFEITNIISMNMRSMKNWIAIFWCNQNGVLMKTCNWKVTILTSIISATKLADCL